MIFYKNAETLSHPNYFKFFLLLLASSLYPLTTYAQPFAYVASIAGSTVTVVNVATHSIVAAPYIPGGMTGIAAAPNGTMVYVTAQSANQVEVFSTVSNSVIGAIGVGVTPVAVAFTPNGAMAYVANQGSNTVSVINTALNATVATIPVGTRPTGVAVNPSGTRVLVTNNWDTVLSVIDTASNSVVANISAGFGLSNVAISPTGAYAYATNQSSNSLAVINLASNSLVGNIPVQQNPTSVAVTPNGARAFVTNGNSNSVSVVDTASSTVIATLGVGANPTSVAITPDGSRAEVTNAQGYSASLLDTNSLYVIGTLDRVGIFPSGVTIAPAATSLVCNYSLSASGQAMPYTGGSGSVGINAAAGCNWTAASNASWITLVSGLSGSGNGATGFNVSPNFSSTPRSGAILIAGQTFTITQAAAPAATPPTPDSASPNAGSGGSQSFTFNYSSAKGYAYLSDVYVLFNGGLNGVGACAAFYNKGAAAFFLVNDAGTALLGPLAPGANATLQNGQCTINGAGSSVNGAGNTLAMTLNLTFTNSFRGTQTIFMYAADSSGLSSGWQSRGSWTVPGINAAPTADSASPASGTGANQTFTFNYSSANGWRSLADVYVLINGSINGVGACAALYDKASDAFYMVNDSGSALLGPLAGGSNATLQNTQCTLKGVGSSVSGSGNTLSMTLNLSFNASFARTQTIFLYAADGAGLTSDWQNRGSWTVPAN